MGEEDSERDSAPQESEASGSGASPLVKLEVFEGPLDLLLHLIKKSEVGIADIPIARIADQFLRAIHGLGLNQAADYLDMASRLVRLKAQMLLPRGVDGEEWEDPRAELVRRLLEGGGPEGAAAFVRELREGLDRDV